MAPPSQKAAARPITVIGPGGERTFNIRPEDLTWTEPARVNAVQTLGPAWVDALGPGIAKSSSLGTSAGRAGGPDWKAQFQNLYNTAFKS